MNLDLAGHYEGEMVSGRYHGKGVYKYLDFKYEGNFQDGQFHGEGALYVAGGAYKGLWRNGSLVDGGFVFDDGLQYVKVGYKYWDYCSEQDPRFYSELKDNVSKNGPYRDITSHKHPDLPAGCYDTIDGYYDPKTHMIYSHGDKREELRAPGPDEIDFILTCCRVGK